MPRAAIYAVNGTLLAASFAMTKLRTVLATLFLAAQAAVVQANPALLKSNVVVVEPTYHEKTREVFMGWSQRFDKLADEAERTDARQVALAKNLRELARYYKAQSSSPGHGSGWIWIPRTGDIAFVVTNRHVAGQAESVTLEFDHARSRPIVNCPVIYVDPRHDVAVIEVARRDLPRDAMGFELATSPVTEGSPVWASGFPGTDTVLGQIPVYSLTSGTVSNADYPGPEGSAIAHSATIDPGNSGGPLVIEDPTTVMNYRVVGMNTWKANSRTNVNLAVPAKTIADALQGAQESLLIARDRTRLARTLRDSAKRLADELGSTQPDYVLLNSLISYSFVARRPSIFDYLLTSWLNGKLNESEVGEFLSSPVDFARRTLGSLFVTTFSTGQSNVGAVTLDSITDEDRIDADRPVRTIYSIAGKKQEIVWTFEYGAWRISDASFEQALTTTARTSTPPPEPVHTGGTIALHKPGISLAARIGLGSRSASSDNFQSDLSSSSSISFDLALAIPLSKHVWIATGLGYEPQGVSYPVSVSGMSINIAEEVNYLQIPALLRLEWPLSGASMTTRIFGSGGVGLDVAVAKGGTFGNDTAAAELSSISWYDQLRAVNVAGIGNAGVEFGFGSSPSFYVGLDLTVRMHLLDEWSSDFFAGGANYRYATTQFGLFVKYQTLR